MHAYVKSMYVRPSVLLTCVRECLRACVKLSVYLFVCVFLSVCLLPRISSVYVSVRPPVFYLCVRYMLLYRTIRPIECLYKSDVCRHVRDILNFHLLALTPNFLLLTSSILFSDV